MEKFQDSLPHSLRILSIPWRLKCLIQWEAGIPRNSELIIQRGIQQRLTAFVTSAPSLPRERPLLSPEPSLPFTYLLCLFLSHRRLHLPQTLAHKEDSIYQ